MQIQQYPGFPAKVMVFALAFLWGHLFTLGVIPLVELNQDKYGKGTESD
jgi:hypothetical protein